MRINIARLGTPVSADREQLLLSLLRQMYDQPTARERRRIVDVLDDAIGMTVAHPPVIPSPEGREEVRIVPAIGGVQVAYGLCVGRTFPAIRDLCIVSDRPLYIADLPRDECDYYSQEVVTSSRLSALL